MGILLTPFWCEAAKKRLSQRVSVSLTLTREHPREELLTRIRAPSHAVFIQQLWAPTAERDTAAQRARWSLDAARRRRRPARARTDGSRAAPRQRAVPEILPVMMSILPLLVDRDPMQLASTCIIGTHIFDRSTTSEFRSIARYSIGYTHRARPATRAHSSHTRHTIYAR